VSVCVCGVSEVTSARGEGEGKRLRWWYIVDGLYMPIWNSAKKPLAIALSGMVRGLRGRDGGGNVNNVQYKSSWNCHCIMNIS
jgi:hypothetical protein